MITISKPLSAAQVHTYHAEEFSNARDNYYTQGNEIAGQWQGQLAQQWGLAGDVREDQFRRLADGQHPHTGDALVRSPRTQHYTNAHGEVVKTMAHRAGWDATVSAPKSVSLTALVGGDVRVRHAHRDSVAVALDEMERYVQARIGGTHPAETTGRWVAARFEHDSARPVDGYAAPQLHTHVVVFNVTERLNGEPRALQPQELYKAQQYGTAVYRSELAARLTALGYEIERGTSGQPEIRGYSEVYLAASSPRRHQIEAYLERAQRSGAGAAEIAAHQTRSKKGDYSHDDMQARHRQLAHTFGDQPARVVQAAQARVMAGEQHVPQTTVREAVTYAMDRNFERDAVVDERTLVRDALRRSMGDLTLSAVKTEFARRVRGGQFVEADQPPGTPGRAFTTREMIALERENIHAMQMGQQARNPIAGREARQDLPQAHPHLSAHQRTAVDRILASRDQIQALEGVAGAGKTTALAAVRDGAERAGYRVEGFAPTSRAAQQLADAGIPSSTLQRHLTRQETPQEGPPRLYVLDESSLASTRQMHAFLQRLETQDRVLLVGDVRQHQAVEAGRPYHQLQEAGIAVVRLDDIIRQRDPALKHVVEQLSRGEVHGAVRDLDHQGRVHEIADRLQRFAAIARDYARHPEGTLVVSPDNQSRMEINKTIHGLMQTIGRVESEEHAVRVLVPRQEVTGADRQWATQYEPGNVVRYTTGSKALGIESGAYARVNEVQARENRVTVTSQSGERVTYDPRRLQGVTLYREADRALALGDRVQFTAPYREQHVANRELGTIEQMDATGHLRVRLESGRAVALNMDTYPHLDFGYAVTSHSSQGQTADRVLVHVDTAQTSAQLVNQRLAYVAVSRGRFDAQVYTDDKTHLAGALNRDVSHQSAIQGSRVPAAGQQAQTPSSAGRQPAPLAIER